MQKYVAVIVMGLLLILVGVLFWRRKGIHILFNEDRFTDEAAFARHLGLTMLIAGAAVCVVAGAALAIDNIYLGFCCIPVAIVSIVVSCGIGLSKYGKKKTK